MRGALLVCFVVSVSACAGSPGAPTSVAAGTTMNIAGTWNGTIASSNNETMQMTMVLTQSGSDVSGTWTSSSVNWSGQVTGSVKGSSFDAQFKFSGQAANGTVCTGTANVAGTATASTLTLTSASGVLGGSCPAPLPAGLKIEMQRQ